MGKALWYGGGVQFQKNDGTPNAGGFINTYEPGTTTPKTTYKDSDLSTPHENPIELDAYGRPPGGQIWLDGNTKAAVADADGVTISNAGGDNLNPDTAGFGGWSDKEPAVLTKTAAYTVAAADDGKLIVATSGTWTLTLPAAATAGNGFIVCVLNSGTGTITVDADGAETINDATTMTLNQGGWCSIRCDGAEWHATGAVFKTTRVIAYLTSDQTLGDATLTDIGAGAAAFTEVADTADAFDAASGVFTAPSAGVYLVLWRATLTVNAGNVTEGFFCYLTDSSNNNLARAPGFNMGNAAVNPVAVGAVMLELASGATVKMRAQHTTGVTRDLLSGQDATAINIMRVA